MNLEEGNHTIHPFSPNPETPTPNGTPNFLKTQNVDENQTTTTTTKNSVTNWPLLVLNCSFMAIGIVGGPLSTRLYYIHGGSHNWLMSCMQTAGFPILLFPLAILYILHFRKRQSILPSLNRSSNSFFMEPKLFFASAFIGVLLGLNNYMYSLGLSKLPVSTSSILVGTQLAFIACFSRLIMKQKFTSSSVNAVVLMTLGSILLGIRSEGDRSSGITKAQFLLGFFITLGSAALAGLMMPLIELSYSKATRLLSYSTALQFQFIAAMFSTIFNIAGMLINKDFQAIPKEASEYGLGRGMYPFVLVACAILWQLSSLGGTGVILYTSSLFSGVFMSILPPFTVIAAVITYHEDFTGEKGMALALCLWGFGNYFYGEYKNMKVVDTTTTATQTTKEAATIA